jgi:hypothetical protein
VKLRKARLLAQNGGSLSDLLMSRWRSERLIAASGSLQVRLTAFKWVGSCCASSTGAARPIAMRFFRLQTSKVRLWRLEQMTGASFRQPQPIRQPASQPYLRRDLQSAVGPWLPRHDGHLLLDRLHVWGAPRPVPGAVGDLHEPLRILVLKLGPVLQGTWPQKHMAARHCYTATKDCHYKPWR